MWTTIFSVPLVRARILETYLGADAQQAAISSWLVAQYEREGRFPTLGTRDGTRIVLYVSLVVEVGTQVY